MRAASMTSNSPLLGLPPAIRRQIYLESGLCTGQIIDLSLPPNRPSYSDGPIHLVRLERRDFYTLLFICRTIYAELSHIIYSENTIIVQNSCREEGFEALRNLTALSTTALRSLTVHLNATQCWLYGCEDRGSKKPLTDLAPIDQKVLNDWWRTMDYITANVKPFNLELYLISHVHDYEIALRIVHPIIKFAKFKRCVIRLSHNRDPALERLAEATALSAIGGQQPEESSSPRLSFLDLPPEIRDQVLQYTDLVTPTKEVMWNPKDSYSVCYCTSRWDEESVGIFGKNSAMNHSFKFRKCWKSSRFGCFCRRFHAVSSSSSMCHCWTPPTSLFLVCHAILDAARRVFFSNNRFIITSSNGPNAIAETTPERLEASIFLTDLVPFTSLCWLRSVELVFPPCEDDYLRATEPAYSDWLRTLDYIKHELNTPMMDLHVHMADPEVNNGTVVRGRIYRANFTKQQFEKVITMYVRLLYTFKRLNGFKCFTMHLELPSGWNQAGYQRWKRSNQLWESYERQRVQLQETLGRRILGESYNQFSRDGNRKRDSQWEVLAWDKYDPLFY